MAYSSVGRPVFYIDNYQYHKTIGTQIEKNLPESTYSLESNPVFPLTLENRSFNLPVNPINYNFTGNMKYYMAFLNHDFYGNGAQILISDENDDTYVTADFEEVLNGNNTGGSFMPLNGSTIITTSVAHDTTMYNFLSSDMFAGMSINVGTVSYGIQYTMPHSPDLKLSMEIEMDGVNTTNTSGGGTISNVKYTGNPLWVNGDNRTNPFDVYGNDGLDVTQTGARRNGRKSWSLKFSYMSETDLFSSNPKGGNYTEHPADSTYNNSDLEPLDANGNPTSESKLAFNIETDDSFYAQVWNKTLGLPFIFQPNSNDNDDFYICRFDQDSLKVSQSGYKVYDISVKIIESW